MSMLNKLANCKNMFQGKAKKVLCICSAGLLRSPTIAKVLGEEYGYNTRAAGITEEYALIDVSDVLLEWADEVVTAESWMAHIIEERLKTEKRILSLDIPDSFEWNDPELVDLIREKYTEC